MMLEKNRKERKETTTHKEKKEKSKKALETIRKNLGATETFFRIMNYDPDHRLL